MPEGGISVNLTAPLSIATTQPSCRPKADRRGEPRFRVLQSENLSSLYAQVNVLVTGPQAATEVFVRSISPTIRVPIHYVACDAPLILPSAQCTLVLRGIDALTEEQQEVLLRWLDDERHGPRHVISLAATPLYERVQAETFKSALYYRLNVINLDVTDS
jgi:sigma-54-interacting transcriptional regulator